jgi:geranylgeranyl pyrophosphate synthase
MEQNNSTLNIICDPIRSQLSQVEYKLNNLASQAHPSLNEAIQQISQSSGKRLRPIVTLLSSSFNPNNGDLAVLHATAVELLHMASLIHDDTVDNSPLRRGLATASNLWGNNIAVQLGDFIFATSAAFALNTNNLRVIRSFTETLVALSTGELIESFDAFKLDHDYKQYKERISLKTASLFITAAEGGAILSGAPETTVKALKKYGHSLGVAFQIIDDIMDFEGTEQDVGKPVGHDLLQGTLTLPGMLLLERYPDNNPIIELFAGRDVEKNREKALDMVRNSNIIQDCYKTAEEFCTDATNALQHLPKTIERQSLLEITRYIVERNR